MNININNIYLNDIENAAESIIDNTCFSCRKQGNRKGLQKINQMMQDEIVSDKSIEKRNKT